MMTPIKSHEVRNKKDAKDDIGRVSKCVQFGQMICKNCPKKLKRSQIGEISPNLGVEMTQPTFKKLICLITNKYTARMF